MFCTKFKRSGDPIQVLKVIRGLGFTLHHWHKLFVEVYNNFKFVQIPFDMFISVDLLLKCVQNSKKCGPMVLQALEAAILESVTRDRLTS